MRTSFFVFVLGSLISIAANAQSIVATTDIQIAPKTTETLIQADVQGNPQDYATEAFRCVIRHNALALPRIIKQGSTFQILYMTQSVLKEIPLAELRASMEHMNAFAYATHLSRSELHELFLKNNAFSHPDQFQISDMQIVSTKTGSKYSLSCRSAKAVSQDDILSKLYEIRAQIQPNSEM